MLHESLLRVHFMSERFSLNVYRLSLAAPKALHRTEPWNALEQIMTRQCNRACIATLLPALRDTSRSPFVQSIMQFLYDHALGPLRFPLGPVDGGFTSGVLQELRRQPVPQLHRLILKRAVQAKRLTRVGYLKIQEGYVNGYVASVASAPQNTVMFVQSADWSVAFSGFSSLPQQQCIVEPALAWLKLVLCCLRRRRRIPTNVGEVVDVYTEGPRSSPIEELIRNEIFVAREVLLPTLLDYVKESRADIVRLWQHVDYELELIGLCMDYLTSIVDCCATAGFLDRLSVDVLLVRLDDLHAAIQDVILVLIRQYPHHLWSHNH
jgi:hypothetical protein